MPIHNPFNNAKERRYSMFMTPQQGQLLNAGAPVNGVTPAEVHEAMLDRFRRKDYICVGATAAFAAEEYRIGLYPPLGTAASADGLAHDLVEFINTQAATGSSFTTFLAVFASREPLSEKRFERLLWKQLELLDKRSSKYFSWDPQVSSEPTKETFAFSFAAHAFFVVGMHAQASREARRFPFPTLAFNLHSQFEALRKDGRFEAMRKAIRHRDEVQHGSINPMLADFGKGSEAAQYAGRVVEKEWRCPFHH